MQTRYLLFSWMAVSELFYSAPDYDPAVLAADEARKDVVPAAYLTTGITLVSNSGDTGSRSHSSWRRRFHHLRSQPAGRQLRLLIRNGRCYAGGHHSRLWP